MDAKSVWPGFDYAHTWDPGRGVEYYPNANRCRAIAVFDKQLPGNTRATTFVKVQFLDPESGEPITKTPPYSYEYVDWRKRYDPIDEVRAREIVSRWDEYVDETAHRKVKEEQARKEREQRRAEQQAEWDRQQKERERVEAERRAKAEAERAERERKAKVEQQAILSKLAVKGLTTAGITIGIDNVVIPKTDLKRWLGVSDA